MENPTYNDIAKFIEGMTEEQRMMTATVYNNDEEEYYPITKLNVTTDCDVLDENHPYFEI
jgi:hypothetical protein